MEAYIRNLMQLKADLWKAGVFLSFSIPITLVKWWALLKLVQRRSCFWVRWHTKPEELFRPSAAAAQQQAC